MFPQNLTLPDGLGTVNLLHSLRSITLLRNRLGLRARGSATSTARCLRNRACRTRRRTSPTARRSSSMQIDSTLYRAPPAKTVEQCRERAPKGGYGYQFASEEILRRTADFPGARPCGLNVLREAPTGTTSLWWKRKRKQPRPRPGWKMPSRNTGPSGGSRPASAVRRGRRQR
jgi:hypothetical protein